jgi:hypothetical protein
MAQISFVSQSIHCPRVRGTRDHRVPHAPERSELPIGDSPLDVDQPLDGRALREELGVVLEAKQPGRREPNDLLDGAVAKAIDAQVTTRIFDTPRDVVGGELGDDLILVDLDMAHAATQLGRVHVLDIAHRWPDRLRRQRDELTRPTLAVADFLEAPLIISQRVKRRFLGERAEAVAVTRLLFRQEQAGRLEEALDGLGLLLLDLGHPPLLVAAVAEDDAVALVVLALLRLAERADLLSAKIQDSCDNGV